MPVQSVAHPYKPSTSFDASELDDLLDGVKVSSKPRHLEVAEPAPIVGVVDAKPVLAGKALKAGDQYDDVAPRFRVHTLAQALSTRWGADAHAVAYVVTEGGKAVVEQPRLSLSSLPVVRSAGLDVRITSLWADYDLPSHASWNEHSLRELLPLAAQATTCAVYTSAHGLRFVQSLTRWLTPEEFPGVHAQWLKTLEQNTKLRPDPACKDWTRLYRLPYVIRDGKATHVYAMRAETTPIEPPSPPPVKPKVAREVDAIFAGLRPSGSTARARAYAARVPCPPCGQGDCQKSAQRLACRLVELFGIDAEDVETILVSWAEGGSHKWSDGELKRKGEWATANVSKGGALWRPRAKSNSSRLI